MTWEEFNDCMDINWLISHLEYTIWDISTEIKEEEQDETYLSLLQSELNKFEKRLKTIKGLI